MTDSYEFSQTRDDPRSTEGARRGPLKSPPSPLAPGLFMIAALLAAGVAVGRTEAPAVAPTPPAAETAAPAPTTPPTTAGETPAPAAATAAPAPRPAPLPASEKPAAVPTPAAESATAPAPDAGLADEVKGLKSQVDELTAQLKQLRGKLDDLPKAGADPVPIQAKLDELGKSVAAVTPLSEKVDKLDERMSGVDSAVKTVRDEVSGLSAEVKKLASAKPAPGPAAEEPSPEAPAFADGVALFKAAKYKDAGAVFKKVAAANPDDARVYYYEALVNGLTTGDWQGETLKLAAKGATLEKSGSTKPADVDAAFSDLSGNLKRWLAFFRTQAK